jgi:serine/threonine-protein kinase HipA
MADLVVHLYGTHIGDIVGKDARTFDFRATPAGRSTFGLGSTVLSESVPLEAIANRGRARARRNFFTELLPEGDLRTFLAEQATLRGSDTIGLLSHYGRDVAGAVQIWDPANPGEPRTPFAVDVSDVEVAEMLRDTHSYPLGNTVETGKSLINGVQTKIVLALEGNGWRRVGDGYPSSHILKPQLDESSTTIFDEEYGTRIARLLGLASHDTWIDDFDGIHTLVVERYDRAATSPDGRIHQEDMNQALGASGVEKYQKFGGRVSLQRMARLLRLAGDAASLERLARMNVLAAAIGNLDMHAKNVSLLHPSDDARTLAPAYDVVPMAHLDNDHEMALAINGSYQHAALRADDLVAEVESWGVPNSRPLVMHSLEEIRDLTSRHAPLHGAWPGLQDDVSTFTARLLAGRTIGPSARFGGTATV